MTNRPFIAIFLCSLLLLVSVTPVAGGVATPTEEDASATTLSSLDGSQPGVFAQTNETTTNETTQHEDPEDTSGEGSTSSIAQWLSGSMAARLNDGAINISQGQYQTARSIVGDDFDSDLSRFVNVAGETDSGVDEGTTETFNETRQKQQEYAEQTQEYWETYEEYQEAREEGDTERARELARELDSLQSRINETGARLVDNYDELENQTGESFDSATESTRQVRENVMSTTITVIEESLIATEIQITNISQRAAFDDPLVVQGRLVTENGTGVAGSDVTIAVPGTAATTTTAANGTFTLTHRPTALPTGSQNLTVVATPNATSVYQSATATVSTEIDTVEPTLEITDVPDRVSYGDPVPVTARLLVDGRPVESVPLTVTLDGVVLDRNATGDGGHFVTEARLPATIDDGTAELRVHVGWAGRAIGSADVNREVIVEETATELSIEATNGTQITVAGTLRTTDGLAIGSQPVQIRVDGSVVTTVQTNSSGWYTTTLGDAVVTPNESVNISATYDVSTSNLGLSTATTSAILTESSDSNSPGSSDNGAVERVVDQTTGAVENAIKQTSDSLPLTVSVLIIIILGIGGVYRRYYPFTGDQPPDSEPVAPGQSQADVEPPRPEIMTVESQLERGKVDDAAVALYGVLQSALHIDVDRDLTHRERYQAVSDSLTPAEATLFERATTLYEQARFAPISVSSEQVRDVLSAAQEHIEPSGSDQPADD